MVKQDDHLIDAMRHLVMSGRGRTRAKPQPAREITEYV